MAHRKEEDQQTFYICGQCKDKQRYLMNEDPPVPCPDCGWWHMSRRKYKLPNKIRLDLTQYG